MFLKQLAPTHPFAGGYDASFFVSHRGFSQGHELWKMPEKHLLYKNFTISSGPWGPDGKQTIRNVHMGVQGEG